ncbi:MAG: hypothetical protein KDB97_10270 [Flavobacteriales bacterium]|nr:hypothetical protein [Flavobacteriales bacterium]
MKNSLHVAALMSGLLFSAATFAQSNASTTRPAPKPATASATQRSTHEGMAWHDLDIERMTRELGLSTDQATKLKDIAQRYGKGHETLKAKERNMGREASGKMEADMVRKRDEEVRNVLTAEQFDKWDRGKGTMHAQAASNGSTVHGKADASAPRAKATAR